MKVLTFSRFYPAYHPKKGEPTRFVEKITSGLFDRDDETFSHEEMLANQNPLLWKTDRDIIFDFYFRLDWKQDWDAKNHTIRAGNRWNVGDWFSPRVWSDKPYKSKQIEFAQPIEVKKVWKFEIKEGGVFINDKDTPADTVGVLASNDGLSFVDMMHWFKFPNPFTGQIICWNESIEY